MSTLSQRLARLRESGKMPAAGPAGTSGKREPAVPGKPPATDRLAALRRRDRRQEPPSDPAGSSSTVTAGDRPPGTGWVSQAEFVWERTIEYPALLPESIDHPFVLPEGVGPDRLVFYDLETTGLSGGAGNTAFLIGLGRQESGTFRVTQLFLADYPGEEALLRRYAELAGELPQVSFNGRSFDSQILRTRFLLNRMPPVLPPQIDLLYPSRHLWKGVLENQRLRTLEEEVLDFRRKDDLPGSEAPEAWFEWLAGDPGRIDGVFRHNADDIVSLGRLAVKLEEWGRVRSAESAGVPSGARVSSWGMARQWSYRDREQERIWLVKGWQDGDRRCGLELAVRYRRSDRLVDARDIWERLYSEGQDVTAAVELAKFWEHRAGNPDRALEILQPLKALPLSDRDGRDLMKRMRRLEAKITRRRME